MAHDAPTGNAGPPKIASGNAPPVTRSATNLED